MYTITNNIVDQKYDGLKVEKLVNVDSHEVLSICIEKGATFPEHTSPTNAHLVMLEGDINFYINGKSFQLKKEQLFDFPKDEAHSVKANENSKFLIIR